MFESFQLAGTSPVLIDKLNKDVTEGAISSVNDLSIHAVMTSRRMGLCLRSVLIPSGVQSAHSISLQTSSSEGVEKVKVVVESLKQEEKK